VANNQLPLRPGNWPSLQGDGMQYFVTRLNREIIASHTSNLSISAKSAKEVELNARQSEYQQMLSR
jgi:hypothetical protein